jgi:hypothetical protein
VDKTANVSARSQVPQLDRAVIGRGCHYLASNVKYFLNRAGVLAECESYIASVDVDLFCQLICLANDDLIKFFFFFQKSYCEKINNCDILH